MAAHVDITDNEVHTVSLTTTGSARGIDGPGDASVCWMYVNDAAAVVYYQTGDQTDGTTDLSTSGGPLPNQSWVGVPCSSVDAEGPSLTRPTVYVQTDTNPTDIRYRFTRKAGDT